jgi:ATP-binding cassette, subfamily B (MDR/TAP), member 1
MIAAEKQLRRIRHEYMRALLRQEVAFYDQNAAGELAARLIEDTITINNGLAEKVPQAIQALVTFLSGLAVGFARSWALTLVIMACLPIIVVIMGFLAKSVATFESRLAAAYSRAGDAATEVFSSIRNVLAFGNVQHEVSRYDAHLEVAERNGSGKGVRMGAAVGGVFGLIFISYGFASLVGGVLIINDRNDNPSCQPTLGTVVPDSCFTGEH